MALTKVNRGGLNTGIVDSSNATFLTATSAEGVTLAGTLAVTGVHTVGTNAVATSDGGAKTTSIVQGLVKMWCLYKGTNTNAIIDSFNTTSVTDNGVGNYTYTIANDFSVRPAVAGMTNRRKFYCIDDQASIATGTVRVDIDADDASASDSAENTMMMCGDLA